MSALDFKEIAPAHTGKDRDAFEMFARDFLEYQGYKIISGPDRGVDEGRDLVIEELRSGISGETKIRWLVSCKHKAYSGKSVVLNDEPDIIERVTSHGCAGFVGFYSSIPASSLAKRLENIKINKSIDYVIYDRERIESILLRSTDGVSMAMRYFPNSTAAWSKDNPKPSTIFENKIRIDCDYCDKDLLDPLSGIVVIVSKYDWEIKDPSREKVIDIYWCCKGNCDAKLRSFRVGKGLTDGWEDITDIINPTIYLKWVIATINQLHAHVEHTDVAIIKLRKLLMGLYPYVAREPTSSERERVGVLFNLPTWAGGI